MQTIYETNLGIMIFSLLAKIIVLFLINIFRYNFSHLKIKNLDRKTKFILITADILMIAYFILPPYINYIDKVSWDRMLEYKELLTAVYFLLFICFVNLLDRKLLQELQEKVVSTKKKFNCKILVIIVNKLEGCIKKLEALDMIMPIFYQA